MSTSPERPLRQRPLSPHLSIYKPQISSVLSILHRMTGAFLASGIAVLVLWLWGAAYSPLCYAMVNHIAAHWVGQLLLFGWSVAFYYHLSNGIRHLFWDMGYGFAISVMTKTGIIVLLSTLTLTAITWNHIWGLV